LNPENAQAYAGLAHALVLQGIIESLRIPEAYHTARAAAERALGIQPDLAEAKSAAAWVKVVHERDWEEAGRLLNEAVRSGRPSGRTLACSAVFHVASAQLRRASELSYQAFIEEPLNGSRWAMHAWIEYLSGDFTLSREHVLQGHRSGVRGTLLACTEALLSLQMENPRSAAQRIRTLMGEESQAPLLQGLLGYALVNSGQKAEARELLSELVRAHSQSRRTSFYGIAVSHLALGEPEEAVRALEQAYTSGPIWSCGFHCDPILAPLREHAAFKAFVERAYPSAPRTA
jgi:tetratricopeptide (TPR) repeat protein